MFLVQFFDGLIRGSLPHAAEIRRTAALVSVLLKLPMQHSLHFQLKIDRFEMLILNDPVGKFSGALPILSQTVETRRVILPHPPIDLLVCKSEALCCQGVVPVMGDAEFRRLLFFFSADPDHTCTLPGSARGTELFLAIIQRNPLLKLCSRPDLIFFADFLFTHPPGQIGFYRFALDLLGVVMVSGPMA